MLKSNRSNKYKPLSITYCTFGSYKETQYKYIPLEWLIERLNYNKLTKFPNVNKRIEFYINERIKTEKEEEEKKEDIGFISFD